MIELRNNQEHLKIDVDSIKSLCMLVLEEASLNNCTVSVSLVEDREIISLNREYFRKDSPTDVISFPMEEKIKDGILLGDVVVCINQAIRSIEETGLTLSEEISLYLIHGILHLLGECDDNTANRQRMESRQNNLLRKARDTRRLVIVSNLS